MNISISLTEAQEAYARELIARGQYSSMSAVFQHGLELLGAEMDEHEVDTAALRVLLEERLRGPFISMEEGRRRTEKMIAERKAALQSAKPASST